jgi:hypothetical protein
MRETANRGGVRRGLVRHARECASIIPDRALKVSWFIAAVLLGASANTAWAQEDKKTDDEKPADPGRKHRGGVDARPVAKSLSRIRRQIRSDLYRRNLRQCFRRKIYRVGNDDDRGIGIFARVSSSPSDRNLIDRYTDGGIEFVGLSDARPKDKFGIAGGYAHVSRRAHALDVDFQQLMGPSWPPRSFESLVTAVYQYEVRPGWTLQPTFQYFVHPGGGATNPTGPNPGKPLKDAAAFGLRTVLKF